MLVIALAAAMLGGATYAWFTDNVEVGANITAGTIVLGGDLSEQEILLPAMAPGDSVTNSFEIVNDGSLDMYYRVYFSDTAGELSDALTVKINGAEAVGLASIIVDGYYIIAKELLTAGDSHSVTIEFILPTSTDSTFQGKTFSGNLVVQATQARNNDTDTQWD